jgi:hypothetical protein
VGGKKKGAKRHWQPHKRVCVCAGGGARGVGVVGGGMGHAEWVAHCLSRSGTGIAYLGDTGSQVRERGVGGWLEWGMGGGQVERGGGRRAGHACRHVCVGAPIVCLCSGSALYLGPAVGKRSLPSFSRQKRFTTSVHVLTIAMHTKVTLPPPPAPLQVFASGVGDRGGTVVLADTLAPPTAATAATLISPRGATPTSICLVPSSSSSSSGPAAVLVVGDDAGEVRGYDVRVLDDRRPLWSTRRQQQQQPPAAAAAGSSGSNGVTSLTCWDPAWMGGSSSSVVSVFDAGAGSGGWQQCSVGDLVAAGSKDGSISLYNCQTGSLVQQLGLAHYTERKGLLERVGLGGSGRGSSGGPDDATDGVMLRPRPAGAVPAAVSGVQACAEGLVSVGWDGVVRFAPFSQLLDEWSAHTD